jgi:hypothetical protein
MVGTRTRRQTRTQAIDRQVGHNGDHRPWRQTGAPRVRPLGRRRWTRGVRAIFTAPFRVDPAQLASLSGPQREAWRRAALLRLILSVLLAVSALVLLPAALLGQAAPASLVRLGLVIALCIVCLLLNRANRTTVAGLVVIYGTLGIIVHFLVTNPGGIDLQVVLTYALLTPLILMSGLIVPGWATWLTALLVVATTLAGIFALPFSPALGLAMADPTQLRFAVAGSLVTLDLFIAVLSWVTARSAGAAMQAAARG